MFVPLVDILRCVNPHDETWLVASIDRAEERDMIEGTLGCPICLAEYPVRGGVVYFGNDESLNQAPSGAPFGTPPASTASVGPSEADALRLAAALDLTEGRMTAVLHGAWGVNAQLVRGVSPTQLLLVNCPAQIASGDGISLVVAATAPFAQSSVDAVAVDATIEPHMLEALLRSLRARGRVLAPVSLALPPGLVEIARDDEVWVAQLDVKVTVSAPVQLTRRHGA